jgi:hypothetical protein
MHHLHMSSVHIMVTQCRHQLSVSTIASQNSLCRRICHRPGFVAAGALGHSGHTHAGGVGSTPAGLRISVQFLGSHKCVSQTVCGPLAAHHGSNQHCEASSEAGAFGQRACAVSWHFGSCCASPLDLRNSYTSLNDRFSSPPSGPFIT